MLEMIRTKKLRRIVGLMSGTSVDGIDAALIEISGEALEGNVNLIAFENTPFPEHIKNKIFDLFIMENTTVDKIGYMNVLLGELYSKAVFSVVERAGVKIEEIDLIGSHGQTIYHHPQICNKDGYDIGYTVQIGEGSVISKRTNIPCVTDFRVADMAVGGQGAPLVPFTEFVLNQFKDKTVLLQNIGGIGNITVLPANCSLNDVYAFDTGPGNMIIDGLVSCYTKKEKGMDEGGSIAKSGVVVKELLQKLCNHTYFKKVPPKSTGREMFGAEYISKLYKEILAAGISMPDVIATVTDFTAWSIENSYINYIMEEHPADILVIAGGGSYNSTLVSLIRNRMKPYGVEVYIQEDIGLNSDAKEAIAFAILADCTIAGKCNNIPSVTGAYRPVVMGKISL